MKYFKIIVVILTVFAFQDYKTQQMIKSELNANHDDWKGIEIENIAKVFFTKGSVNSIVVERTSDKDKKINFEIINGIACIKPTHDTEESKQNNYNVYITAKNNDFDFQGLNIGILETNNTADFKTIKLKVTNSAKVDLTVNTEVLQVDLKNVMLCKISGKTDKLILDKENVMLVKKQNLQVKDK